MVEVSERGQAPSRARLRLGDIGRLIAVWLVASAALALAAALLPNLTAKAPWAYFAAAAVAGLLGLVFRPVLIVLAARIGWLAVVLAGLVGQALRVDPGGLVRLVRDLLRRRLTGADLLGVRRGGLRGHRGISG